MKYLLGIDQGGTKTLAVIADEDGNVLGLGKSQGACHVFDCLESAMQRIRSAAYGALDNSGAKISDVVQISAGITGADWPEEYTLLEEAMAEMFPGKSISIYNDCIVGLYGGPCLTSGAVICGGTGLNIGVVTEEGIIEALGYYINDDDHAGMALGKKIFQSVVNIEIGLTQETMLKDKVLRYYNCSHIESLLKARLIGEIDRHSFKNLVLLAIESANEGDCFAQTMLEKFGYQITRYLPPLLEKYQMREKDVEVIVTGGIFKENSYLLKGVDRYLQENLPKARLNEAVYEPVAGAVLAAYRDYFRRAPDSIFMEHLYASCRCNSLLRILK